jgi:transcription antitermination factor NusG
MTSGMVVTIHFGPFAGLNGVVVSSSGERTTIRLILKGRAVLVDLETTMLRVPVRRGKPYLGQRRRPV